MFSAPRRSRWGSGRPCGSRCTAGRCGRRRAVARCSGRPGTQCFDPVKDETPHPC